MICVGDALQSTRNADDNTEGSHCICEETHATYAVFGRIASAFKAKASHITSKHWQWRIYETV